MSFVCADPTVLAAEVTGDAVRAAGVTYARDKCGTRIAQRETCLFFFFSAFLAFSASPLNNCPKVSPQTAWKGWKPSCSEERTMRGHPCCPPCLPRLLFAVLGYQRMSRAVSVGQLEQGCSSLLFKGIGNLLALELVSIRVPLDIQNWLGFFVGLTLIISLLFWVVRRLEGHGDRLGYRSSRGFLIFFTDGLTLWNWTSASALSASVAVLGRVAPHAAVSALGVAVRIRRAAIGTVSNLPAAGTGFVWVETVVLSLTAACSLLIFMVRVIRATCAESSST